MLKINDRQWKEFKIKELFLLQKGQGPKQQETNKNGDTLYISATNLNNGLNFFCDSKPKHNGECITVNDFGIAFYQENPFVGTHIQVLIPKFKINRFIGLFICNCINSISEKYSFGYAANYERLNNQYIMLPVRQDDPSSPDYDFMTDFIRERMDAKRQVYVDYCLDKLRRLESDLDDVLATECDDNSLGCLELTTEGAGDRVWKEFKIKDFCETINIAKSNDFGSLKPGNNVFVGRTSNNNGIQGFVETTPIESENCFTISMVATVMKSFWQENPFVASQNILILRNKNFNKYNALFIKPILDELLKKYSYGNPVKKETFKNERILLPVCLDNFSKPDWEYMENQIKLLKIRKFNQYFAYIKETCGGGYKTFLLKDLFTIEHGKRLTIQNRLEGRIPFLTASENNQGVTSYISNNQKIYKDVISVDMFGHAFYHNYNCCGDDNIYFFINDNISSYSKKYITTMINKNGSKFSYGKQFRQNDALNQKIILPVDNNGNPNYKYMDVYIKVLEFKKYLEFLQ